MPLTGSESLFKATAKAALLAQDPPIVEDGPALDSLLDAIALIIPHIIANAVVVTVGSATTQTGPIT